MLFQIAHLELDDSGSEWQNERPREKNFGKRRAKVEIAYSTTLLQQ